MREPDSGGLYIESRLRVSSSRAEASDGRALPLLRVTSPTITTPLAGVPEPFLAGHYMKVLCPDLVANGGMLARFSSAEPLP